MDHSSVPAVRVALFIDGRGLYGALRRHAPGLRLDYDRLATWLVQAAAGAAGELAVAHYYAAVTVDAPTEVVAFLTGLASRPGYVVRRAARPGALGAQLLADLLVGAAKDHHEGAVLVCASEDMAAGLDGAAALGRRTWVAAWTDADVPAALRRASHGVLELWLGGGEFGIAARRVSARAERPTVSSATSHAVSSATSQAVAAAAGPGLDPLLALALAELRRAEVRLPHVTRGYFVTRWRAPGLPPAGPAREVLVERLVAAGLVEELEVADAVRGLVRALRCRLVAGLEAFPP